MSSILRTIDALKEVHIGDYVQFHDGRLGYVEALLPDDLVRIRENDGTTRPRRFNARKHLVVVIPQSGETAVENRTLLQPPSPNTIETSTDSNDFTDETKELICILKKTNKWTSNNKNILNPFYEYLRANNDKNEGWIRNILPKHTTNNESGKDLNLQQRMIFVNTYNLLSGFPKTYGALKSWSTMFYKAWGVRKNTSLRIINSYYNSGFIPDRKTRKDKGQTLINSTKKRKSTYTSFYVYKREQTHRRYRTHTQHLNKDMLKEEFESKSENEQLVYSNIAKNFVHQGYSIHHNLIKALEKTG